MTNIFALIQLVLRLFRLWDQFAIYVAEEKIREIGRQQEALRKAVDKTEDVKTPEDAYAAQKGISDNLP